MNNTTATSTRPYYSPVSFEGESYDELVSILDGEGLDAAIQHAAQWDYGDEFYEGFRLAISKFAHEDEYGPVAVIPYPNSEYWLVVSRAAAYAYLVRKSGQ